MKNSYFVALVSLLIFGCAHNQVYAIERSASSVESASPTLLLDYSAGFQAGWSWLKIYSDGTVSHQERICCPPHDTEISEESLKPEILSQLNALIVESQNGKLIKKSKVVLGLGQKIGTLTVYAADGTKVTLEDVNRTVTGSGTSVINKSPATSEIMRLVGSFAKNIILK